MFRRCAVLAVLTCCCSAWAAEKPISRIAFGSCARQDLPQPIWRFVADQEPDVFVFLGDNVYADTENMDEMKAAYERLEEKSAFRRLRSKCEILATWDDRDYGVDDGGAEYPKKDESQKLFLDFFREPKKSERRQTPGVYDAKVFGPAGRRVQIILLDTRYFRSPLKKDDPGPEGDGRPGPYVAQTDENATMLGEAQWTWLEEQLSQPADVRIIASSIQVIPTEHRYEKWANMPAERDRLFKLIYKTRATGVVFISGDRHMAELSRFDPGVRYELWEVTSSALNQQSRPENEINPYRLGCVYRDANFGVIVIDWERPQPTLRFEVRKEDGGVFLEYEVELRDLQPGGRKHGPAGLTAAQRAGEATGDETAN